ncbi:MAG: type II toxin-antitoxin system VapC family toxin [Blastocatellia bacterium]
MIAFDTNVLTEILLGNPRFVARAATIPLQQQAVPVIVVEELIRGRLNVIRQAEAQKARVTLDQAYALFQETFTDVRRLQILSFTSTAESLCQQWRRRAVRVSTHDLRIAATCIVSGACLVTRNRRDFERISGLTVEFWE